MRTSLRIQADKMSSLCHVAGLSLKDSQELRHPGGAGSRAAHLPEWSQLRWFGHLIRMPCGHVQLVGGPMVDREHAGGIIYLERVARERDIWVTLLNRRQEMDGWMFKLSIQSLLSVAVHMWTWLHVYQWLLEVQLLYKHTLQGNMGKQFAVITQTE